MDDTLGKGEGEAPTPPVTVPGGVIPVYFHVINRGPGIINGDVPDAQIATQIEVMNDAFASSGWTLVS